MKASANPLVLLTLSVTASSVSGLVINGSLCGSVLTGLESEIKLLRLVGHPSVKNIREQLTHCSFLGILEQR
jgi:hypothetical protein